MALARGRALLHLSGRIRRVVDTDDIYHLEAQGEVLEELGPLGFVRIHRDHAVHAGRVREIRPVDSGSGWEVRLEPPVSTVLPVSRRSLAALLAAYRPAASRIR